MTIATGLLLILVPIIFNGLTFVLQRSFGYPAILNRPTTEVLDHVRMRGQPLITTFSLLALVALLFAAIAVLVGQLFVAPPWYLPVATLSGVLAATFQAAGLLRWPLLVPVLANVRADADSTAAHKDAAEVVFEAAHRFLGGIGGQLSSFLAAIWTILVGLAILQTHIVTPWLASFGIIAGAGLILGILEEANVRWAIVIGEVAAVVWSIWLIVLGVRVLFLHL